MADFCYGIVVGYFADYGSQVWSTDNGLSNSACNLVFNHLQTNSVLPHQRAVQSAVRCFCIPIIYDLRD